MEYNEPIKEVPVTDYEFAFVGGKTLPLTLEESDSIQELHDRFVVNVAPKPNLFDPDRPLPSEVITVFKQHLTAYITRSRMRREPTQEELVDMRQLVHNMSDTVQ